MLNFPLEIGKTYDLSNGYTTTIVYIEPDTYIGNLPYKGVVYNKDAEEVGGFWFTKEGKDPHPALTSTWDIISVLDDKKSDFDKLKELLEGFDNLNQSKLTCSRKLGKIVLHKDIFNYIQFQFDSSGKFLDFQIN